MNLLRSVLFGVCLAISVIGGSVKDTTIEFEVVPDVIDKAPSNAIEVQYPSGVSVDFGNVLTPTQVKDIPTITYNADDNAFYTIIMTDPDAPSRQNPVFREMRHWIVGNIPGNRIADGETLFDYIGSGPSPDTGLHRYVFLLYKQTGKLAFGDRRIGMEILPRMKSRVKDFVNKHNLGDPIAVNFFQAEYDDYVPILHAKLG